MENTRLLASASLARYYRTQNFAPAWTDSDGPTAHADRLIAALRDARDDGLRPADYHTSRIDSLRRRLHARNEEALPLDARTDFELLCTNAFLLYSSHLLTGRLDPVEIVPSWNVGHRHADLTHQLEDALGKASVRTVLDRLRPSHLEYAGFRRALARYRTLADQGGWPSIPDGPKIEEGTQDARVPLIRQRLQATGDLTGDAPSTAVAFTDTLRRAVSRFQERHGLDVDGIVGPETRRAMNVPVEDRIRQIVVNLERHRWLPRNLGTPHVLVNIADFWLRVVEDDSTALQMRVVVGTRFRQTPVFSDRISYLVFNPYWHVPPGIATADQLPLFQEDPSLVSELGFEVFDGWGPNATPVDPSSIPWDSLSASNFPYHLRQRPGPHNPLGQVKFMFPNPHDVYLHDTPARSLFDRQERCFSSGCVRVEHPAELASFLLRPHEEWTADRVREVMGEGPPKTVRLKQPVPVHLLYWTAWMEEGALHFREDVYDRDDAVASALAAPLSRPPDAADR